MATFPNITDILRQRAMHIQKLYHIFRERGLSQAYNIIGFTGGTQLTRPGNRLNKAIYLGLGLRS